MIAELFKPVVVLAARTMVMWAWLYVTRIPAINKLPKTGAAGDPSGWTGAMLDAMLPRQVQWKAHNYNHLHAQPTVFYAIALLLGLIGQGDGLNATIAWAYVALRVVHSLVQATVNHVMIRFSVFVLASLCLIALIVRALIAVF